MKGNIIEKSGKRTEPICPYFYDCGGCQLQHFNYVEQLEFKRLLVKKNGGCVENNRFFFLKTKFFVDKWVDLFIFYSKTPQKRGEKGVKTGACG